MQAWLIGSTLVLLCGLNPILGILGLSLAAMRGGLALEAELAWIAGERVVWLWTALLALQFLADLYFVPITARDRQYLNPERYVNAYLHARLQSFLRPLAAALVLAALPLDSSPQLRAVGGFIVGTAIYWATAWTREQVAIQRGALLLLLLETTKNIVGIVAAVLAGWSSALALALLWALILPAATWAGRLRREQILITGGQVAGKDT